MLRIGSLKRQEIGRYWVSEIAQVFVVWLRLAWVGSSPKSRFYAFFFFVFEDELHLLQLFSLLVLLPPPDFAYVPREPGVTGTWKVTGLRKLVRTASKYRQFWQEGQTRSWSGKAFFYHKCDKWIRNGDKNIYIHSYFSVCVLESGRVMLRLQLNQVRKRRQNIHYEWWEQFYSWIYVFPAQ